MGVGAPFPRQSCGSSGFASSHSRKEEAVRKLKKASPLAISIALGRPSPQPCAPSHQQSFHRGRSAPTSSPPRAHPVLHGRSQGAPHIPPGTPNRFLKQQTYDIHGGRHKLNASQNRAIRQALEKPFTVIQGPPGTAHSGEWGCLDKGTDLGHLGTETCAVHTFFWPHTGTGKTLVGLHIIFWFHKSNQEQVPVRKSREEEEPTWGPCILYCGPSNKSVDVVAGELGAAAGLREVLDSWVSLSRLPLPQECS